MLSNVHVSFAYPFQSLGYIVVATTAFLTLKEPFNAKKILGIAIICTGVIVLSISAK